ncbi:SMP-30/gluconolactonase/LRE family protein [Nocardia sp. NPDC052566]|uniref:SMP-30/gluconolactonase/LRE family protein n=1 Tax=Nocardia sp. NPDC052566 TaxID=3364330 RepID=UPI0037CAEF0F
MSHLFRRRVPTVAVSLALAAVTAVACGKSDEPAAPSGPRITSAYALPDDRAYPEGIAADPRTGDTYVGSYTNGAVYRAARGAQRAEVFLPAGADGRKTANGLRVDQAGRLWVIDSTKGVTVYDIATRAALARFEITGTAAHFVNDLAITPDGTAYLTDSMRGVVYRVTPAQVTDAQANGGRADLTVAVDLNPSLAAHGPDAITLNGIVADAAGRYLLVVDMTAGELHRIALNPADPAPIRKVTLRGGDVKHGDGLELNGDTLWVVQNTANTIARWRLTDDYTTATLETTLTNESLSIPTTLTHADNHLLVVASQFDKGGPMGQGTPAPFAVLAVDNL